MAWKIKQLKDVLGNYIIPKTRTSAVYDENNVPLDDFINKTNSKTEQISHPNIFLNSDFRKGSIINQKNQIAYCGTGGYSIDMWKLDPFINLTISEVGCKLVFEYQEGVALNFYQIVESDIDMLDRYYDKNFTVSIEVIEITDTSNIYLVCTDNCGGEISTIPISSTGITSYTFTFKPEQQRFSFGLRAINSSGTITIARMKLELGTISTLANDSPPNPQQELAKCQRYQMELIHSEYSRVGSGLALSETECYVDVPLPTTMRIIPTCVTKNISNLYLWKLENIMVTSIALISFSNNIITFDVKCAGGLVSGEMYTLQTAGAGMASLLLDANL